MKKLVQVTMLFGIFFFFFPETAYAGCAKCRERGLQLLQREREQKELSGYDSDSLKWGASEKSENGKNGKKKKKKS